MCCYRVWHKEQDTYYVMFEKPNDEASDGDAAAAAGAGAGEEASVAENGATAAAAGGEVEVAGTSQSAAAAAAHEAGTSGTQEHQSAAAGGGGGGEGDLPSHPKPPSPTSQPPHKKQKKSKQKRSGSPPKQRMSRVRVDSFPVASALINRIMPLIRAELMSTPVLRERLFQAVFHTTLSNQAMVTLAYHKQLDEAWKEAAQGMRERLLGELGEEVCSSLQLIGRSRKQKVCLDVDYVFDRVTVGGKEYTYMQVRRRLGSGMGS